MIERKSFVQSQGDWTLHHSIRLKKYKFNRAFWNISVGPRPQIPTSFVSHNLLLSLGLSIEVTLKKAIPSLIHKSLILTAILSPLEIAPVSILASSLLRFSRLSNVLIRCETNWLRALIDSPEAWETEFLPLAFIVFPGMAEQQWETAMSLNVPILFSSSLLSAPPCGPVQKWQVLWEQCQFVVWVSQYQHAKHCYMYFIQSVHPFCLMSLS